jgi:hypothetical protein
MPRFNYEEYITRLCEDSDELRAQYKAKTCKPGSAEYKVLSGNYIRIMNTLGNALANERLHQELKDNPAASGDNKLRLIPNGDSNTD